MKKRTDGWMLAIWCGALALFFILLFYTDNKYQTPPPYGRDGVISLNKSDLQRGDPIFLIDGWQLTDRRVQNQPTWIGEYSNLRRGDLLALPHGAASYRLTLRYSGSPTVATVDLPGLCTEYVLLLDGQEVAQGVGSGQITFLLTPGDQTLTVETVSQNGFYSGMYYPPALGFPETIDRVENMRGFVYALAFLVPLALALFTLCRWNRRDDPAAFWFGLLCCFFSLYVAWYFVELFRLPLWRCWFLVEGVALYGLCFCVVRLTALAAGAEGDKMFRIARLLLVVWPVAMLFLSLLIPSLPGAAALHGWLKNGYFLFVFFCVLFLFVRHGQPHEKEYRYILVGDMVFGTGLVLNLFFSNRFEPIRFFWQFEWSGLLLVGLFGGMMVARNRRILEENSELTNHLEQLVEKRTSELNLLLRERKAFFADMAHDLKAPVFATKGFIDAIRKNDTGVDRELSYYLEQAELKQIELSRRLQGLSLVNALDKIETLKARLSVRELLEEVHAVHHAEAEVASVPLLITPPESDCFILAQPEKLDILFENLIYNALKATGVEDSITIAAHTDADTVHLSVSDTGCGVPEEELPHIFQRFFVGVRGRCTGTGLGLYIVRCIVTELGGTISVSSKLGEGTTFLIILPIANQPDV